MPGPAEPAKPRAHAPAARTVISAGHKNFHLLFTAAEMARRGRLAMLITGALPRPTEARLLARFSGSSRKLARFLNRTENVEPWRVRQCRFSEVLGSCALALRRVPGAGRAAQALQGAAMRGYGRRAARHLRGSAPARGAAIYHFRAGFGHGSIAAARAGGMRVLCDHSIVHPSLLDALVAGRGRFPVERPGAPGGWWAGVLQDIEAADRVLVNSDFVARTFAFMGADMSRVEVAYLGVEDKFFACLPEGRTYRDRQQATPLKLLFAGGLAPRKGVDVLQESLLAEPDLEIHLALAGSLPASAARRYAPLLGDPRVRHHGMLGQQALAALMSQSDVFVFPSFAEGSARVVFEAMAAGCAVIATPNAGSVLEDGIGGYEIAPGDSESLRAALHRITAPEADIAAMGRHNHALVRRDYTQAHYGARLEEVYRSLCGAGPGRGGQ